MSDTAVGPLHGKAGRPTSGTGQGQAVAKEQKVRIHVSMGRRSKELLDELAYKTGGSNTDVFRNALRLYAALIEEEEKGNELYVKDKDGNLIAYRVFV